ncbi:MAG: hypothetical protein GX901_10175 [Lentisphaerae bacterium]|nr:hypothetical protein [Lentisphaerota bacterium]
MDFNSISIELQCAFGFPVSCLVDEEDGQVIARVFMVPENLQEKLINEIRDMEEFLVPDDYLISVIPYSEEETLMYYPEMYHLQQSANKTLSCEYMATSNTAVLLKESHKSNPAIEQQDS